MKYTDDKMQQSYRCAYGFRAYNHTGIFERVKD